jgi:D-alanyl-lipoteichoic acid acyltransferase DltB (MBOAT superfamily)
MALMWLEPGRPTVAAPVAPHRRYFPLFRRVETDRGTLFHGEPPTCRREWRRFLAVLAHMALLVAVAYRYQIEGRGFQLVLSLAAAVLPFHYTFHYRWKKLVFVGMSVAGLCWVIGLDYAAYILPIGAALISVCLLPVAWRARVLLVAAVAGAAGLARAGLVARGVPEGVWTVLGSLFMFRLIVFLYEIKHATERPKLLDAVGYFFLLPNFCFMLFPVVDYRTFVRGHYQEDIDDTQQAGLRMMTRGMLHLLAYRLVYHELLLAPDEVHGPLDLLAFLACNYLLYLRVSGQFHLACGLLHLFGYKLPETHHNYLLATGFTDYWRRINIYWKDFMVRLVFHPVAFRLKRQPQPVALAIATAAVFVVTWFLHAYQLFWRQGSWTFSATDAVFWGILGVLVMINVQLDARNPARHRERVAEPGPRGIVTRALKTAATFLVIALLWSLWTSPSLGAWAALLQRGLTP